jgi:pimeloyl-ACP methyl ester carboxylesterase
VKWHSQAKIWRTPVLGELSVLWIPRFAFRPAMRKASRLSDEQIRHIYDMLSPQWKWMVLRLYRAFNLDDFTKWEASMLEVTAQVPTLVLWGEQDPYLPSWIADRFNARKVVRFEDAGHWLPAERSEETARELRSFFAET